MNELQEILKNIQFISNKTIEDIAIEIGYSRAYLNDAINKGKNKNILFELKQKYQTLIKQNVSNDQIFEQSKTYLQKRNDLKNTIKETSLSYYEVGAAAGTEHNAEIFPVNKTEDKLHIADLFKGSQYAIKISGNSMTPNYPSGATIGIRQIEDKIITPGSVYVIEKDNDLWLKRLFYKDDNQDCGLFECISDNDMVYENGIRKGKAYYPPFNIEIDKVRKLFKVTGIYKPNELTVIT